MARSMCVVSSNSIAREGLAQIFINDGYQIDHSVPHTVNVDWTTIEPGALIILDISVAVEQKNAIEKIRAQNSALPCLILTDSFDYSAMLLNFKSGAIGYIVKDLDCNSLLASVNLAYKGLKVIPEKLLEVLTDFSPSLSYGAASEVDPEIARLSRREFDVLCCLMSGHSNKVIARELDVTEATIKVHVKAILRKLKMGNRTQAAMWAIGKRIKPETVAQIPLTN